MGTADRPGAGHGHGVDAKAVAVGRWPRIVVLALIAVAGVLAVAGVVGWWPDGARVAEVQGSVAVTADGVAIVDGEVLEVRPACISAAAEGCGPSEVRVLGGEHAGTTASISLTPEILSSGIAVGDRIQLFDASGVGVPLDSAFSYYRADRGPALWVLAIVFVVIVLAVAWLRGLMALVSLGFAGLVVLGYLVPALLSGQPAVSVTLAAAALVLIVMLYVTHGVSMRTSVALLGALIGVGLSTLGASLAVTGSRLGAIGDESAGLLAFNVPWLDVQQIVIASVVLAGLGTLNDVTITQASALWELRAAAPGMGRWALFRSAMRIGRDHVASTVYTIVFAYLGTALALLLAVQIYGGGPAWFLTWDPVAEEIVRTLVGGMALLLAMPVTTAIGALVVLGPGAAARTRPGSGPRPGGPRRPGISAPGSGLRKDGFAYDNDSH